LVTALGIGRIVPELDPSATAWPYTVVGIGFALYGVALIGYGTVRARQVERSLAAGSYAVPNDALLGSLTVAGAVLGLATAAVILLD